MGYIMVYAILQRAKDGIELIGLGDWGERGSPKFQMDSDGSSLYNSSGKTAPTSQPGHIPLLVSPLHGNLSFREHAMGYLLLSG